MSDQGHLIEPPSQYERLKAKGKDMSWYERNKPKTDVAIPLEDDACSNGSIYRLLANGTVWTIKTSLQVYNGEVRTAYEGEHRKVRDTGKALPSDVFICMHSKVAYPEFGEAIIHSRCGGAS